MGCEEIEHDPQIGRKNIQISNEETNAGRVIYQLPLLVSSECFTQSIIDNYPSGLTLPWTYEIFIKIPSGLLSS